jgi:cyclopropane fatty-acyl-phospholipid synthase-like methyltransferase
MGWVDIDHPSNILELGCHNGYNLIYWANQHPETTAVGVDISTPLLRKARERIHEAGIADRVVVFDSYIEDFQSPPDITDIVLTETLEHVQDAQAVLNAVEPMVEPGVNLWITVPSNRWGNYSHVRGIRAATLASMLQDAGFDVADIKFIDERRVQGENLTRCLVRRQS